MTESIGRRGVGSAASVVAIVGMAIVGVVVMGCASLRGVPSVR